VLDAAWYDRENEDYVDGLTLVNRKQYTKTMVERTSRLKHISCEVMIILCHGSGVTDDETCPNLTFYDNSSDLPYEGYTDCAFNTMTVWAYDEPGHCTEGTFARVILKDIVDSTEMVLLMCCDAGQIVQNYLDTYTGPRDQDFFYFSGEMMSTGTHGHSIEILLSLIINLVDGPPDYSVSNFSTKWKPALVRIMQIVKLFDGDSESFWWFLTTVGLVSTFTDLKKQQQLPHSSQSRLFRVNGHKINWNFGSNTKESLLGEFQTLTLATWNPEGTTYLTPASPELGEITFTTEKEVDTFLKKYKLEKGKTGPHRAQVPMASVSALLGLLAQLHAVNLTLSPS
jgi:hypothetical protein